MDAAVLLRPQECSGKGTCDRASGLCQCFAGSEGAACALVSCPNGCSGHGNCRAIAEKQADAVPGAAFTYSAWDGEISQSCSCDAGWFGPDCSLRTCPKGDDPLTKYESFTKITFNEVGLV